MKNIPNDIKDLDKRIKKLQIAEPGRKPEDTSTYAGAAGVGFRLNMELLSGVAVGGCVGYVADYVFSTHPFFLVVFLLLGGAAGFLSVYRFVKSKEQRDKE